MFKTRPMRLSLTLVALLSGCSFVTSFFGDKAAKAVAGADALLVAGDVPGGIAAYEAAATAYPDNVDAAVGAAYGAYLQGQYPKAEALLAGIEAKAAERAGEIKLRRALVALAAGNLDQVRTHGEASGLPAGKLLAAEVALADGERDKASTLLKEAQAGPSAEVGRTAGEYLALIGDEDLRVQGLSETQALWALGQRKIAVQSVEELVKSIPDEREDKEAILLLWAGRAASAGEAEVAGRLVDSIGFAPAGQQWRVVATKALVACGSGEGDACKTLLDGLEGTAPPDGLKDARATAALLLADKDAARAIEIAGPGPSAAVARALLAAGDVAGAKRAIAGGPLAQFLSTRSGG